MISSRGLFCDHIYMTGIQSWVRTYKSHVVSQDQSHVTDSNHFGDLPGTKPFVVMYAEDMVYFLLERNAMDGFNTVCSASKQCKFIPYPLGHMDHYIYRK